MIRFAHPSGSCFAPVYLPSVGCRARTDASDDQARAKQRLNAFLLRSGFHYDGKTKWTEAHLRYLRHLTLPHDAQKIVLEEP